MPNPESIRKQAEKRAQRKAARTGNEAAVVDQTAKLAKLTELQKKAKTSPEAAAELQRVTPPKPKVIAKKDRQAAARKAAEVQADADARVVPTIDEDKLELSYYTSRGIEIPLHVLNRIAKRADVAIRDEARDIARAVAEVTYDQVLDRDQRNRHKRERRMVKALNEMAALKANQEAQKAAATKE
jgi:hypothetical protein